MSEKMQVDDSIEMATFYNSRARSDSIPVQDISPGAPPANPQSQDFTLTYSNYPPVMNYPTYPYFLPPQSNFIPNWNYTQPQPFMMSPHSNIPAQTGSITNPFLSKTESNDQSNIIYPMTKEELNIDNEIMERKDQALIQSKKIQKIKIDFQNEFDMLNNLNMQVTALEDRKKFFVKKRRVNVQNQRHEMRDEYRDNIDEIKNQRPKGTCQYVSNRNTRCRRKAEEDHTDGKEYCSSCLNKVLREERDLKRGNFRVE
jgi:hypothetical protein